MGTHLTTAAPTACTGDSVSHTRWQEGPHKSSTGILAAASVSATPCCRSLPLGPWISGSGTTFSWLQDIFLTHVQDIVIL